MFADSPHSYIKYGDIVFHYVKDNNSDRVVWCNPLDRKSEGKYTYVGNLHYYNIQKISFSGFITSITSYLPNNSLDKKAKITINKIFDYYVK